MYEHLHACTLALEQSDSWSQDMWHVALRCTRLTVRAMFPIECYVTAKSAHLADSCLTATTLGLFEMPIWWYT